MVGDIDRAAVDLALARIMVQRLKHCGSAMPISASRLVAAFNSLDDAGVFAQIDAHTGYAAPEEILKKLGHSD